MHIHDDIRGFFENPSMGMLWILGPELSGLCLAPLLLLLKVP